MARDRAGGTVSRALNGGHNVSPAAAAAVERAVRSSGYVVNQTARNLVTRRTNCFAFVFSEPQDLLFEDPNIATLLRATTDQLAQMQQTLVLMICASPADHARVTDYLRAGHVDGAMLVSTDSGDTLWSPRSRRPASPLCSVVSPPLRGCPPWRPTTAAGPG